MARPASGWVGRLSWRMIERNASICAAEALACSFKHQPVDTFAAGRRRQGPRVTIDIVCARAGRCGCRRRPDQVDRRPGRFGSRLQYGAAPGSPHLFEEQADDRELPVRGLVDEVRFEGVGAPVDGVLARSVEVELLEDVSVPPITRTPEPTVSTWIVWPLLTMSTGTVRTSARSNRAAAKPAAPRRRGAGGHDVDGRLLVASPAQSEVGRERRPVRRILGPLVRPVRRMSRVSGGRRLRSHRRRPPPHGTEQHRADRWSEISQ